MRHHRKGSILLLAACSQCREDFQDGKGRYILGRYPMEQFCTYKCAESFLENDRGLKRALPLPAAVGGKGHHPPAGKGTIRPPSVHSR